MEAADVQFGRFLNLLADLAGTVPAAARRVTLESAADLGSGPGTGSGLVLMRAVKFDWKFQVARRGDRLVLFFLRRDGPEEVLLHGRLGYTVEPVPERFPIDPVRAEALPIRLVTPPFLVRNPDAGDLREFAGDKATPDNTILMRFADGNRLAITDADRGAGRAWIRHSGFTGELRKQKRWPLAPFLDLLMAIADWTRSGFADGGGDWVAMPAEEERNEFWQMVYRLTEAYCSVANRLRSTPDRTDPLESACPAYGLVDCHNEVSLRLNDRGELAQPKDDESFQILLRLRFHGDDSPRADLTLGPPDFLRDGELHEALLEAFLEATVLEELGEALGVGKDDAGQFIRSRASKALILRLSTQRSSDTDENLFAVSGPLNGAEVGILLRGRFRVEFQDSSPVVKARGLARIQFAGPLDRNALALDDDDVDHLLRVVSALHGWSRLVK